MICVSYTDCHNSYMFYRFTQSQPNVKQPIQSGFWSPGDTSMENHEVTFHNDISATVKPSNFTGAASYCSLILFFTLVSN